MADITKDAYDESQRHTKVIFQRGRDVVDFELNEFQDILRVAQARAMRDGISGSLLNPGSLDDGYLATGTGAANQVTIGAGTLFTDGIPLTLGAAFIFSGFTTSGAPRTDLLYLSVTEKEISDPNQIPQLGETTKRRQVQATLDVAEGVAIPADTGGEIWEGGIRNFLIATVTRAAGVATIDPGDVVDERKDLPANIIGALPTTAGASLIGYAGSGPWADATTLPADTVEATIDQVVSDLGGATGAAKVGFTPVGDVAATDVQAAIAELDTEKLDAADIGAAGGAALVGFTPTGDVAATDVQAAIAEVDSEKVSAVALATTAGAATVGFDDGAASNFGASEVQSAILGLDSAVDLRAPLASPTFTGTVTIQPSGIQFPSSQARARMIPLESGRFGNSISSFTDAVYFQPVTFPGFEVHGYWSLQANLASVVFPVQLPEGVTWTTAQVVAQNGTGTGSFTAEVVKQATSGASLPNPVSLGIVPINSTVSAQNISFSEVVDNVSNWYSVQFTASSSAVPGANSDRIYWIKLFYTDPGSLDR